MFENKCIFSCKIYFLVDIHQYIKINLCVFCSKKERIKCKYLIIRKSKCYLFHDSKYKIMTAKKHSAKQMKNKM